MSLLSVRSSVNYHLQETRSRLSKTVDQILRDNVAVPYFHTSMETRSAEHLVRFWLEAESFRSTSWSRVRAPQPQLSQTQHLGWACGLPWNPQLTRLPKWPPADPQLGMRAMKRTLSPPGLPPDLTPPAPKTLTLIPGLWLATGTLLAQRGHPVLGLPTCSPA